MIVIGFYMIYSSNPSEEIRTATQEVIQGVMGVIITLWFLSFLFIIEHGDTILKQGFKINRIESKLKKEEVYIKICQESKELQKSWKPKVGDICYGLMGIGTIDKVEYLPNLKLWCIHFKSGHSTLSHSVTWIPTIDQLKEYIRSEVYGKKRFENQEIKKSVRSCY